MSSSPLRFLHISDTHFGPTRDFNYHGRIPYVDAERLVNEINALPAHIEFIIHTGDVVTSQDPAAYACASEVLSKLKVPLYFATGNHDDPTLLNQFPLFANRNPLLSRTDAVTYTFEHSGHLFIAIDAKNPDDDNPSGLIAPDQLSAVEKLLSQNKKPFIIFNHFPPIPIDAPWMDANLLITNGNELHQLLKKHASLCRGAFFGHLHQPLQLFADGVLYVSVPSSSFQFGGWPTDVEILSYNQRGTPGMNLVTIMGSQLIVKHIALTPTL